MVLIIDDLLLLPIALIAPDLYPNLFMLIFNSINDFALKQLYDIDKINDSIKENRLLYEMDEISEDKYKKRNKKLMEELSTAKKVEELTANTNVLSK